jgi:hypothetical protein
MKLKSIILVGGWIGASEFIRNELLFKSFWLDKYNSLGLDFPSSMINNLVWAIWSFTLAGLIIYLSEKLSFRSSIIVTWLFAFGMMWLVIGNMNVLPYRLLIFALPLSLIEVIVAILISKKT